MSIYKEGVLLIKVRFKTLQEIMMLRLFVFMWIFIVLGGSSAGAGEVTAAITETVELPEGAVFFFVRDPDGNVIEFHKPA